MADDEIRADAKLKNLPEGKLDELWLLRHPLDGGKRKKIREIAALLPKRFGLSASISTVSGFYKWLRQKRRTEAARKRAEQAKRELLEQNPDATPDELERLGQMIFTSETVEDGDIKGFVALLKASNTRRKLEIEERRVKLLEEKARKAEQIEALMKERKAAGGGLSDETLEKIERTLGML